MFPFNLIPRKEIFKLAAVLSYNHRIDVGTGERWRLVVLRIVWYTLVYIHVCAPLCLYLQAV